MSFWVQNYCQGHEIAHSNFFADGLIETIL